MKDAGQEVSVPPNPYANALVQKIKPLLPTEYAELLEDPTDEDVQGALKIKIRRLLKEILLYRGNCLYY